MKTNEQLQLNSYKLTHDKEYTAYRQYRKISKTRRIKGRANYRKFVKAVFETIAEEMLERDGGVCINKLGYWFIWKPPKKVLASYYTEGGLGEYNNFHTNHYLYLPTFFPARRQMYWCMDKAFNKRLTHKLNKKIREGKKYKTYINSLRQSKFF